MGPEFMNDEFISGIVLLQKQHQLESENRGKKLAKPGSITHHLKKILTSNVAFPSRPKNIKQKHAVYVTAESSQHNLVIHLWKVLTSLQ